MRSNKSKYIAISLAILLLFQQSAFADFLHADSQANSILRPSRNQREAQINAAYAPREFNRMESIHNNLVSNKNTVEEDLKFQTTKTSKNHEEKTPLKQKKEAPQSQNPVPNFEEIFLQTPIGNETRIMNFYDYSKEELINALHEINHERFYTSASWAYEYYEALIDHIWESPSLLINVGGQSMTIRWTGRRYNHHRNTDIFLLEGKNFYSVLFIVDDDSRLISLERGQERNGLNYFYASSDGRLCCGVNIDLESSIGQKNGAILSYQHTADPEYDSNVENTLSQDLSINNQESKTLDFDVDFKAAQAEVPFIINQIVDMLINYFDITMEGKNSDNEYNEKTGKTNSEEAVLEEENNNALIRDPLLIAIIMGILKKIKEAGRKSVIVLKLIELGNFSFRNLYKLFIAISEYMQELAERSEDNEDRMILNREKILKICEKILLSDIDLTDLYIDRIRETQRARIELDKVLQGPSSKVFKQKDEDGSLEAIVYLKKKKIPPLRKKKKKPSKEACKTQ